MQNDEIYDKWENKLATKTNLERCVIRVASFPYSFCGVEEEINTYLLFDFDYCETIVVHDWTSRTCVIKFFLV